MHTGTGDEQFAVRAYIKRPDRTVVTCFPRQRRSDEKNERTFVGAETLAVISVPNAGLVIFSTSEY